MSPRKPRKPIKGNGFPPNPGKPRKPSPAQLELKRVLREMSNSARTHYARSLDLIEASASKAELVEIERKIMDSPIPPLVQNYLRMLIAVKLYGKENPPE